MNIVLWVLQVLLAVAFFAHGWLLLSPPPEIVEQMNASLPRWFQLFLGGYHAASIRHRDVGRVHAASCASDWRPPHRLRQRSVASWGLWRRSDARRWRER